MSTQDSKTAMTTVMVAGSMDRPLEPTTIQEALHYGKIMVEGGLLPRHLSKPEAVVSVIAAGRDFGLTSQQSIRSIYFFEGKVTLSADLILAVVKKYPLCEYFQLVESTSERCVCETKRKGEAPTRMEWTLADAQRAGLTNKDNWKKYPRPMLRARVYAELARAVYPDAFMGVYTPEELGAQVGYESPQPKHEAVVVQSRETIEAEIVAAPIEPEVVKVAPRDVVAELAALKIEITKATTKPQRDVVREKLKAFALDAGEPWAQEAKDAYNATVKKRIEADMAANGAAQS